MADGIRINGEDYSRQSIDDDSPSGSKYKVPDHPIHAPRSIRIVCVGAGASGLLMAYRVKKSFEHVEFQIYEKNPDIGGTWFENRYPGCACDSPSHNYVYSFEPSTAWSATYAGSKEIFQYFKSFESKYQLGRLIKKHHQVTRAQWNGSKAGWDLEIKSLDTGETFVDFADILVNASGILNAWRWPAIPGLHDFKGPLLHSARWDESLDVSEKHVGLIGNGSSGIQILPAIQPKAAHVTTFIREATWVSPQMGEEPHVFTEEEKKRFQEDRDYHVEFRKKIELGAHNIWPLFYRDSPTQSRIAGYMTGQMKEKLGNPKLEDNLIPNWGVGCRRLTPGVGYLEALGEDNVTAVWGEIKKVTPTGCITNDGREHKFDVLVCATGFDTSFRPRFPLIGPSGKTLAEDWAEQPRGYLGIAAPDYPNYFMFLGPNCPIGNGPLLIGIETQADYMCEIINRFQTENLRTFAPKQEAVDDFLVHKDAFMAPTVWQTECRSWYKQESIDGKVTALWPGSTLHYMEAMWNVRWDDYHITYRGNRFAYLGNGFGQLQVDPNADMTFYIRSKDGDGPCRPKKMSRGFSVASPWINLKQEKITYIAGSDVA